ncbi:MAG: hypothetical protein HY675_25520 [Chloroflexi bacterium]|nr:hypothetical protein [Chloroflexota bacterium]
MPENFLRHYYDVHQLLATPEVQAFIGTPAYEERKRIRFRQDDNLKISENEAFLLRDARTRALYAVEYQKTSGIYYGRQIPFEDILRRIKENMARL